jgi:dCMP deaminase
MTGPRESRPSWDETFMALAETIALRSPDPNTQVGACIVKDNRVLALGYNGFPKGISVYDLPWYRVGNPYETKYLYVCHAEMNAVLNKVSSDLTGSTIYCTLFPCNECTKIIIQVGIASICYKYDTYNDTDIVKASKRMLDLTNIKYYCIK